MPHFEPIGKVDCNFKEKFGIPRQPGLSPNSKAKIIMPRTRFNEDALKDLEGNNHLWIIFSFNKLKKIPDTARVRPPRLGGNKYVGVYSSRSPYRPNPIGLSLVTFSHVSMHEKEIYLHISNHDLLDGTPVVDIKPFVDSDRPNGEVTHSWQNKEWQNLIVSFTPEADSFVKNKQTLKQQIIEILQNDPRPAYHKKHNSKKINGLSLGDYNIKFCITEKDCSVLSVSLIE